MRYAQRPGNCQTALYVRNIARAAEFYPRVLGLTTLLEVERLTALQAGDHARLLAARLIRRTCGRGANALSLKSASASRKFATIGVADD